MYVHKKKLCTQKKHMYTKKIKKKQTYICFILFFLCTQIWGLIISHCARKPVFDIRWILDLELLLLISCIARKYNRAKTFFVRYHSPPKNPFLLRQVISQEQGLWFLNGNYKKMFLLVQTYLGGQSYCSPPFNRPNPVSSSPWLVPFTLATRGLEEPFFHCAVVSVFCSGGK